MPLLSGLTGKYGSGRSANNVAENYGYGMKMQENC
jgi:hypothetical protein